LEDGAYQERWKADGQGRETRGRFGKKVFHPGKESLGGKHSYERSKDGESSTSGASKSGDVNGEKRGAMPFMPHRGERLTDAGLLRKKHSFKGRKKKQP